MASPKMLVLREEMAALTPRRHYLNRPRTPKHALPGEYAELLARSNTQARTQRSARQTAIRIAADQARGFDRSIPTSGPGRRRAKARRNAQAATG